MKAFMGDEIKLMLQTKEGQRKLREFMLGKERIVDYRTQADDGEKEVPDNKSNPAKSNNAPKPGM